MEHALASKTTIGAVEFTPIGTLARMVVASTTVKLLAFTEPNLTAVAPVKPEPEMRMMVETGPDAGENEEILALEVQEEPMPFRIKLCKRTPLPVVPEFEILIFT